MPVANDTQQTVTMHWRNSPLVLCWLLLHNVSIRTQASAPFYWASTTWQGLTWHIQQSTVD